MKKIIAVLLVILLNFNVCLAEISKVDSIISNGRLSIFLNESNGNVSELDISAMNFFCVDVEEFITYSVKYNIVGNLIEPNIRIINFHSNVKEITCYASLYRNGVLVNIGIMKTTVNANSGKEIRTVPFLFSEETDEIKIFVWASLTGMLPLGNLEKVNSLDNVVYQQYLYINSEKGEQFKVFTSAPKTPQETELKYRIEYDFLKNQVVNLCGYSYTPVLECGYIPGCGINVTEFDAENGVVEYNTNIPANMSGNNNIVIFEAKEKLENELITITVKK